MGKSKSTGRAMSMPSGLAVGAAVSIAVTAVISLLGAQLIMNEIMPQEQIGYCSLSALLLATVMGGITASRMIKHKKLMVCLLSGCIYFCLLLATTAMFFGGQYQGFGTTLITILLGSIAAVLLTNGSGEKRIKHRRKKIG